MSTPHTPANDSTDGNTKPAFGGRPEGPVGLQIRPTAAIEKAEAVRMLLSTVGGVADDAQVVDFMRYALSRNLGLEHMKVCVDDRGRIWSAVLPIVSPGRSALIMTPGADVDENRSATALAMLLTDARNDLANRDIKIAQVMIDSHALNLERVFESVGMMRLAEIVFMQRQLRGVIGSPALPAGFKWLTYNAATHALFAETIEKTYIDSRDCAALSPLRSIEDVIMGHKACGDHEDGLWYLLTEREKPAAVVLLTRHTRESALELAYLGCVPTARRRGLGQLLTKHALHVASVSGCTALHLAVDGANHHAVRMYQKNGLAEVHRRVAWIFDLSNRNARTDNTLPSQ